MILLRCWNNANSAHSIAKMKLPFLLKVKKHLNKNNGILKLILNCSYIPPLQRNLYTFLPSIQKGRQRIEKITFIKPNEWQYCAINISITHINPGTVLKRIFLDTGCSDFLASRCNSIHHSYWSSVDIELKTGLTFWGYPCIYW